MPREEFHRQLAALQEEVLDLGSMVDRQIERALQALVERDIALAESVVRDDAEVNRMRFDLGNKCLTLLAQQVPMARDLRVIVSVLEIAADLERMGDHAEGIASIMLMMRDEPFVKPLIDIPKMATHAREMLKGALDAFIQRDV